MKRILGLPRNVFFLGLVSFFNDFSAEMVQAVMPVFLTTVLGAPIIAVGFLEGFADALASVLKVFSGWISDAMRKRKLLSVFGYALSVGTRPFLALAGNFWNVFGLRVADRVGKGFRDAPRDALLSESSERKELGKTFGYHRMMDTIGAMVGPLSAFFILPLVYGNFRSLFLIAFGVGLFAIASFYFVHDVPHDSGAPSPRFRIGILKQNRRFSLFLTAMFVFGLGALPVPLLLLRAPEIGLRVGTVPLFYFVYSLSFVLAALPLGKLSDRVGQRKVIALGFLAAFLAYLGLTLTGGAVFLGGMFVLLGFYGAATDGIGRALAAKLVEPELLATGQGLLNAAIGLSALFAGVLGGGLWTYFGAGAAFGYAALVSIVGLLVFLRLTGEKR